MTDVKEEAEAEEVTAGDTVAAVEEVGKPVRVVSYTIEDSHEYYSFTFEHNLNTRLVHASARPEYGGATVPVQTHVLNENVVRFSIVPAEAECGHIDGLNTQLLRRGITLIVMG